ncbi:MAG: hypothetical protein HY336_02540 [Candidatus Doudnabacteria bacterium]|nr:hypothetical protein [Candidatus Doudnabacteria bacterium]
MGAYVLAINVISCYIIALIGFWQRRVKYDLYDWIALAGALVGIVLWKLTNDPLFAVVLVSISDAIAIIPSLRKAYYYPFEENAGSFVIGISYYVLALPALDSFSLTTSLYHFEIILIDLALIILVLTRRKRLKAKTA